MATSTPTKPSSAVISGLFSGCVGAILTKIFIAPIDRVRVLIQCEPALIQQGILTESYKDIFGCTSKTIESEGIISLWRGSFLQIIRYFPTQSLNFVFKDVIKSCFKQNKKDPYILSFTKTILSGGISGALTLAFVYPIDYAHNRLAADLIVNGERQFNGFFNVMSKIGIIGMYNGFLISSVGIFMYRLCYFGFFDFFRPIFIKKNSSTFKMFLFANSITILSAVLTYPLDTLRKYMILTSLGTVESYYNILNQGGFSAFFRGVEVKLVESIISSVTLLAIDMFSNALKKETPTKKE